MQYKYALCFVSTDIPPSSKHACYSCILLEGFLPTGPVQKSLASLPVGKVLITMLAFRLSAVLAAGLITAAGGKILYAGVNEVTFGAHFH